MLTLHIMVAFGRCLWLLQCCRGPEGAQLQYRFLRTSVHGQDRLQTVSKMSSKSQRRHRGSASDPSVQLSKSLSWLLRHGAEKEGFKFLPGGFLYVDEILSKPQFHKFSVDDVQAVVVSNDKQRFFVEPESDTGRLKIRANQGHSLNVPDLELEPITSAEEFPVVIHGTYYKFWTAIQQQGLKRMNRTHVHFAAGEPGESGVISGMRKSCDVMIYLDLEKALQGGLKFYQSANNVILCPGNEEGVIAPAYFSKVVDRGSGKSLPVSVEDLPGCGDRLSELPPASSAAVSADDLADELEKQGKSRRKKKTFP